MGEITQLNLPRYRSNHTARFYQVKTAITAGFYQVLGAITQLDFTTSWEQSHSWILPRHGSNHTARFYHVIGAITQLDFTTS